MSKYKASKVIVTADGTIFKISELLKYRQPIPEGIHFDSIMEAEYYLELKSRQKLGLIKGLELQPEFILQEKMVKDGVTHRAIKYIADFRITNTDGTQEIVDIKGMELPAFHIKKKLFEAKFPDLHLRVLTKRRGSWVSLEMVKKAKAARKKAKRELLKRTKVE